MSITSQFLNERIEATKQQIIAYEAAMTFFATNNAAYTYTLDTGQSRQSVTRAQLGELKRTVDSLYNQLATLCARAEGSATIARPAW